MGGSISEYLVVGHIEKPHGTQGEVAVRLLTDHPERVFRPGVVLRGSRDGRAPDPDVPPLRIDAVRDVPAGRLVVFGGVEDRNHAETLRGIDLMERRDALPPPGPDEVYLHDLEQLEVRVRTGDRIGTVEIVYDLVPAPLLEIRRDDGRTLLLPFRREFVLEVDLDAGVLVVDPPAGLFDLDDA
ncbi:MAG: ribosome maturation factor RimM [Longimicrobiales bacterium]|nr:ribosome maturation factor RimM [Longimicrobiales bacterium]